MPTFIPLQRKSRAPEDGEYEHLAAELMSTLRGEVLFDNGSRALYATDASNYRQTPIGVIRPRDKNDIIRAVEICRKHGVPILSRGGGTSLAGQCCNVAVVMDFSKYYNKILEIDPEKKLARIQPGIVLDDLRSAVQKYGLTFGPDPATHNRCTLGGMMGNDSCGVHSVMAQFAGTGARTADNICELEVLTYDGVLLRVGPTGEEELERIIAAGGRRGEIYAKLKALRDENADKIRKGFPDIPRRVSGYNLPQLLPENHFDVARALIGSEGTCVVITEATLHLIPAPKARSLLVLGYPDVFQAGDHVPEMMKREPIGCEGIDHELINYMKRRGMHPDDVKMLPEGRGWLMVEFGGETKQEADAKAHGLMEDLKKSAHPPSMKLYDDDEQERQLWEVRESGLGATAFVPGLRDFWPGWEDSAVPPEKVGAYLRDLKKLFHKYNYNASVYGHFGQGCIHCRIPFDLYTEQGIQNWRAFLDEAADLVISYGGSISGEHGDGQARADLLPKMFGAQIMTALREFKAIFDSDNKMNPGKIVNAYPITSNLRLGADYHPWEPDTHFQFPDDNGSFARAALRCVGVGKCRREDGGTMCPSYQATREEMDTTRGRAHMLFEMLRGETIKQDWRDEHVKKSLDLCLSCKGCKGDCPVKVDIATYKAEFLSHYYEGRLRPVHAYVFGLISQISRAVFAIPFLRRLANFSTQAPLLRDAFKAIVGIAPQRRMPPFAGQSFKEWFAARGVRNEGKPGVLLWPDTFNNYFHPTTAKAATEVLEAAGFQVAIPQQFLCCGRPLYDYGMLDTAKEWLRDILVTLRPQLESGTPIIVLEPSCASVFRDEMTNLFPTDEDAKRLKKQVYLLGEFLCEQEDYQPPKLHRKAVVHGHCHQKSVLKMHEEIDLLRQMGLEFHELDSGCCGMAGAFGFEKGDHYDVSLKCGERVLLPAARLAEPSTLLVADGFSCREQIAQTTNRHALHIAEVLQMAQREGEGGARSTPVEKDYAATYPAAPSPLKTAVLLGVGVLLLGALAWNLNTRKAS
jgi:FAD/FMN-containing dehydrogenase/Fe-S oxidoreductase